MQSHILEKKKIGVEKYIFRGGRGVKQPRKCHNSDLCKQLEYMDLDGGGTECILRTLGPLSTPLDTIDLITKTIKKGI